MKRRTLILSCVFAALVLIVAAIWIAVALGAGTSLGFQVRDSVSGRWVWDASMRLQDRVIHGYYQSDGGISSFRFTRLKPGNATLAISAPGYRSAEIPVALKRGKNELAKPVDMLGLEIPDLAKFFAFERLDGEDIVCQLRPVGTGGQAILNHPCMDLWVGCRVSVQMKGGLPALAESESGWSSGRELFRGEIPWAWDPAPESNFRYTARIPGAKMASDPSEYRVIEYLVVEANPLAMSRQELESLMAKLYAMGDAKAMAHELDARKGELRYFIDASWNVKARER